MDFTNDKNLLKLHGNICFYVLFFSPWGSQYLRTTFFFFLILAEASDSQCRMTSAQAFGSYGSQGVCFHPDLSTHPLSEFLFCVSVSKFMLHASSSLSWSFHWASVDEFLFAAPPPLRTSQRMNFLFLKQLLRAGFPISVATFLSASHLPPWYFCYHCAPWLEWMPWISEKV